MKNGKIFLMLLLVFALFMFAACSTNDNVNPSVPDTTDNNGTNNGIDNNNDTNDGLTDNGTGNGNGNGLTTDSGINNNKTQ